MASSAAAEEPLCYICYDPDSVVNPLIAVPVCKCRGSIRLHRNCFYEVIKRSPNCSVCKAEYVDPDIAELSYNPDDPDLKDAIFEGIHPTLYECYNVDTEGRRHGLSKLFNSPYNQFHPDWQSNLTLYEIRNYEHGALHGTYKRWSRFQMKRMQFLEIELTFDKGRICGPFKEYNAYKNGQLRCVGEVASSAEEDPRKIRAIDQVFTYIGEYKEWGHDPVTGEPACIIHCNFAEPSPRLNFLAEHVAKHVSRLANGCWTFPFINMADYFGSPTEIDGTMRVSVRGGLLHGPLEARTWNGDLALQANYEEGLLHGYYERHQVSNCRLPGNVTPPVQRTVGLLEKGLYIAGERCGKFTINVPVTGHDGIMATRPHLTVMYENDAMVGERCLFNREAGLQERCSLAVDGSGAVDGPATFYDDNGALLQKCHYKQGQLDGVLELYKEGRRWLRCNICVSGAAAKTQIMVEPGSSLLTYTLTGKLDRVIQVADAGMALADIPGITKCSGIRMPSNIHELDNLHFLDLQRADGILLVKPRELAQSRSRSSSTESFPELLRSYSNNYY